MPKGLLFALLVNGAGIVVAGIMLGDSAEAIADLTNLGRIWTGSVLLAMATSLPELVTDVSATRLNSPDLAVGDLFGSNLANMLIFAVVSSLPLATSKLRRPTSGNLIEACSAILLNVLAVVFVLMHSKTTVFGVQPESLVLLLVYLASTFVLFRRGTARPDTQENSSPSAITPLARSRSLPRSALVFALGGILIFISAPRFASSAERLAEVTGVGASFLGTALLGVTTALPEFVTALTAVRLGAFDLAAASLFGSCSFNMSIFFAMNVVYPGGLLFSTLDRANALSGVVAILMMSLGCWSLAVRRKAPLTRFDLAHGLMMPCYPLAIYLVYRFAQ